MTRTGIGGLTIGTATADGDDYVTDRQFLSCTANLQGTVCTGFVYFRALSRIVSPNLRSVTTSMVTPTAFLLGGGAVPTFIGYMGERQSFGLGVALIGCLMLLAPLVLRFLVIREEEEEEDGC
jgi:hypothetical protein